MKTFLSEVVENILKREHSLVDTVCILPGERACIFLKEEFKKQISGATFLPEILSIENFIEALSGFKKMDTVTLLFEFYDIYSEKNKANKNDFDFFYQWASIVLQDFNEIDQHLVSSKKLFEYLKDIKRIEKWNLKATESVSEVVKSHFSFMEFIGDYYTIFYDHLVKNKIGYQGLLYREAALKLEKFIKKNKNKKIVFIGFNALNKAEEFIFKTLLENNIATIFWDSDSYYMDSNKKAGYFFKKYKKEWTYFEKHPFQFIYDCFNKEKIIRQIAASKNVSQIKSVGELLSKMENFENTVLVLADESILSLALNSLPENVKKLNITMGYPLKDMPIAEFFETIFHLYLNREKLSKTNDKKFYYKDILRVLENPFLYKLLNTNLALQRVKESLIKKNIVFISSNEISKLLSEYKEILLLRNLFEMYNAHEFIKKSYNIIEACKDNFEGFEKECLYRYYNLFLQLHNLNCKFGHIQSIKTLYAIYKQLIGSEKLFFKGEPLSGLQLMGMLETRTLDFETVIITSANEGFLPKGKSENSFIPFDVKKDYGLPTYQEKDAIFSYHFYRLIQRAKNVYLFYNTETNEYGENEKSRFLTQLEVDEKEYKFQIKNETISPPIALEENKILEVNKNCDVIKKLKHIASSKGFSPSALSSYIHNPIEYYKKYVLKIKEMQEVEETGSDKIIGIVAHEVMKEFYEPIKGRFLKIEDVEKMLSKTEEKTFSYFPEYYKNGGIIKGKNKLILKVTEKLIQNFLKSELKLLKEGKKIKIIEIETEIKAPIKIENLGFSVYIKGTVDRVDELDGVIRIVDYKTGKVESKDLKHKNFEEVTEDYKYTKIMQLMLYSFLYSAKNEQIFKNYKKLEAGIFSFRNLKSGFLKTDSEITENTITEFMKAIKELICSIFDTKKNFIENKKTQ